MKRNGKTKSGSQRWSCVGCGASATHSIDTAARDLAAFVGWLLSKDSQVDMPGKGRTLSVLQDAEKGIGGREEL